VIDVRAMTAEQARTLDAARGEVDWRRLPPGVTRHGFAAPSGALAGLIAGAQHAPRIILVPGATGSKEDFVLLLPLLADAGFRAESYDLAGQYESWRAGPENLRPPRGHYDLPLFVEDLRAVVTAGPAPVHLVGYSFAGTVVQALAAADPGIVSSLTLVSAPPLSGQAFRGVKGFGRLSGLTSDRTGAALMVWGVRRNLNRAPQHRVRFVRERFTLTRQDSVADVIGLMRATPDLDRATAALAAPKLVVAGRHDLWPLDLHRDFARRIGAELLVTAGGHSPSEDAPVELTRAIVALADRSG